MKRLFLLLLLLSPISALIIQTDGTTITIGNESPSYSTIQSLKLTGSTSEMFLEGKANIFGSKPVKVPLIGSEGMSVDSLKVNGKETPVFFENKTYFFFASQDSFSFTASLTPKQEMNSLSLFFKGPIVRFDLELDILGNSSRYINILSPVDAKKSYSLGSTHISEEFFGLESHTIPIQWEERIKKPTPISPLQQTFASSFSDFQISERQILATHYLEYTAYNRKLSSLKIRTFGRVLSVNHQNWEVIDEDNSKYLIISLKEPASSASVKYTEYIGQTGDFTAHPSVPQDAKTNYHLSIQSEPQLAISTSPFLCREVDVSDLPRRTPILLKQLAFVCEPSGSIQVLVTPLETVPVVTAASDRATYSLLSLESGGLLADLQWTVKSSAKDFMIIDLPEKATILYASVNNQPVKPTVSEGKLLLPLKRSTYGVPMELIFYHPQEELGLLGSITLPLVSSDVPISNLNLYSFLPSKMFYLYSSTNLSRISSYDWPEWRSLFSFLVFLALISFFISFSLIRKEHTVRFALLFTLTLYLLTVFHMALFALVAAISLIYAAKKHLSLSQARPLFFGAVVVTVLVLAWFFLSSFAISGPKYGEVTSYSMTKSATPNLVSERLESLDVLEGGVSVPMKKDVLPVKVEVPRTGKQVSFFKEFQTIDTMPQVTIYYAKDYLLIPIYLLSIVLLYLSIRNFQACRIPFKKRKK